MFSRGARCQALFFLDSLKISRLNEVEGRLAQISVKQFFRITGRSMKSPIPPKAEEVKYSTLCRKLTISRKLQLSVALERRSVLRPGAAKAPLADFDFLAHQRRHQVRHSNMSSSAASLAPSLAPLSSSVPVSLLSLSWCGVVWCGVCHGVGPPPLLSPASRLLAWLAFVALGRWTSRRTRRKRWSASRTRSTTSSQTSKILNQTDPPAVNFVVVLRGGGGAALFALGHTRARGSAAALLLRRGGCVPPPPSIPVRRSGV